MGFVWFLLGLIVGGIIGLTIMCLFQINRLKDYELKLQEIEDKARRKYIIICNPRYQSPEWRLMPFSFSCDCASTTREVKQ